MHLLLLFLLTGCPYISQDLEQSAYDPDGDGLSWEDDCDSANATVGAPSTWYSDADGDGFGDAARELVNCQAPEGAVSDATDCDDGDATIHPGASETCDDTDQDCDGAVDEDPTDAPTWHQDADGDGYGHRSLTMQACDTPIGYVVDGTDCDDGDGAVHPGAAEVCNGGDEDCDGASGDLDDDVADATTWYPDEDGDGFGDPMAPFLACDTPAGAVLVAFASDCDDSDATVSPDGVETCDGEDDDCDTLVDEDDASDAPTWYLDADGDGYGDAVSPTRACAAPAGTLANATDCDDLQDAVHPGAIELCNGRDDDCDTVTDEDDASDAPTWYDDTDGDGYGNATTPTRSCTVPDGYVATSEDCAPEDASIHPGAMEVCDEADVDEDCDGLADDADPDATGQSTWYRDGDGDGYGDPGSIVSTCDLPAGYLSDASDCDDANGAVHPGATETWYDGTDQDCDGWSDGDADRDGADSGADCDDANAAIHPGATETWYDGTDQDCDGHSDWDADWDGVDSGGDCDDFNAGIHPGATETWYDGTDQDCDGHSDWDADGDGYDQGEDCDDTTAEVSPVATEVCENGRDEDCDGEAVECEIWGTGTAALADAAFYSTTCAVGADIATGDVNGDGVDELATGANHCSGDEGEAMAFSGIGTGETEISAFWAAANGVTGGSYGSALALVGDENGDGYMDIVVGQPNRNFTLDGCGITYLFLGPLAGWESTYEPDAELRGSNYYEYVGRELEGPGDVNDDGYDDMVIGTNGDAYLYLGPVTGILGMPDADSTVESDHVYAPGDLQGDGIPDVAISRSGQVWVYGGGPADLFASSPIATISGASNTGPGGDANGDGYLDLLVGNDGAYLLLGPLTGSLSTSDADTTFHGESSDGDAEIGSSICLDGDLNADGLDDIIVGAYQQNWGSMHVGGVSVFHSPTSGSYSVREADAWFTGEGNEYHLGNAIEAGADLDGDGYDDLVVADGPYLGDPPGRIYVFYGSSW